MNLQRLQRELGCLVGIEASGIGKPTVKVRPGDPEIPPGPTKPFVSSRRPRSPSHHWVRQRLLLLLMASERREETAPISGSAVVIRMDCPARSKPQSVSGEKSKVLTARALANAKEKEHVALGAARSRSVIVKDPRGPSAVTILPSRTRTAPSPVPATGEKVCLRRRPAWLTQLYKALLKSLLSRTRRYARLWPAEMFPWSR